VKCHRAQKLEWALGAEIVVDFPFHVFPHAITVIANNCYQNFVSPGIRTTKSPVLILQCEVEDSVPAIPVLQTSTSLWRSACSSDQVIDILQNQFHYHAEVVENCHACMVVVDDVGVLICGDAGAGKSYLAKQILNDGHQLVSDDVVELFTAKEGQLCGKAPLTLYDMIHLDGVEFAQVSLKWGRSSLAASATVDLVVEKVGHTSPVELPAISKCIGSRSFICPRIRNSDDVYQIVRNYRISCGRTKIGKKVG